MSLSFETMYFEASSQYVCWSWVSDCSSYSGWSFVAWRTCPGAEVPKFGWGVSQGMEISHPTMFAVIVDNVAPCLVPQRKKHSTFPKGVEVMMMVPESDSASHSM